MARRWTLFEERYKYRELRRLYINENRTIGEIAKILKLGESTVYDRLLRLKIKTIRLKKASANNKRLDIIIPKNRSGRLSEFLGIMLGDGHLTKTQVTVTLGNKEDAYVNYVTNLIEELFRITPKVIRTINGYSVIYFGSVKVVSWLLSMGLVFNKVKKQVNAPFWIFSKHNFINGFLKGFFDTDGSVYALRFGVQVAFTNRSLPLLKAIRRGLKILGYYPSKISKYRVYLTREKDIRIFFKVVNPANKKHLERYKILSKRWDG